MATYADSSPGSPACVLLESQYARHSSPCNPRTSPLISSPECISRQNDRSGATQREMSNAQTQVISTSPQMVSFHGGAFVAGHLDVNDPFCRIVVAKTPYVATSVDYPPAPAHKMDRAIDSGVKPVTWVNRWKFCLYALGSDSSGRLRKIPPDSAPCPNRPLLCGGSAGALLSTMVVCHFISVLEDYTSVTGCVLLWTTGALCDYDGRHHEKSLAW